MPFAQISIPELTLAPFHKLDKEWALLSAGEKGAFNTMTVSWGSLGTIWNKPAATIYVRPTRYTKEFIDSHERFTLCFFSEQYRKALSRLGAVSGRDGDKLLGTGLTAAFDFGADAPVFEQSSLALVCRKIYVGAIDPKGILNEKTLEANYPKRDFHAVYIGEVEAAYAAK